MDKTTNYLKGLNISEDPCGAYARLYNDGYTLLPITGALAHNSDFDAPDKRALADPQYARELLEKALRGDALKNFAENFKIPRLHAESRPTPTWATSLVEVRRDDLGYPEGANLGNTIQEVTVKCVAASPIDDTPITPAKATSTEFNTESKAAGPQGPGEDLPFTGDVIKSGTTENPKTGTKTYTGLTIKNFRFY